MKIVIAPQSFKGSISAVKVAAAMSDGVHSFLPEAQTILVPVADGGDGTLETLVEASGGEIRSSTVTGPLAEKRTAEWGAMGDGKTAVIEMARTSGLALVELNDRNPLISTTYGLGEAILDALNSGFRQFIIGIGGSATNDGGAGMAQALGVNLLDSSNKGLCLGGADLARLAKIDMSGLDERIKDSNISVACDVTNPLTGPTGASAVYGPQKGATPDMVQQLDNALKQLATIARRDLGIEIDDLPGAGAAGGLGAGMVGFLSGRLQAGADIVLNTVGLASELEDADLVLTGEGSLDYQTVYNKAPVGVSRMAKSNNIPVIAISGSLGEGYKDVHGHGIDAAIAITNRPMTLEEASENAYTLVSDATEQALRLFMSGNQQPTL